MEMKELQLISPKEFQKRFAPGVSVTTIRDLFHATNFPSVQINTRLYTTEAAAAKWLSCMGDLNLLGEKEDAPDDAA